jgi:threonyl-tRNA synthetase
VLGRKWTLGTVQIDMAMPGRFGLRYVGRDGAEHQPAMLHRAVLGSLERFIALYLEHTGGDFPFWLAPVQAAILPISDRHEDYARRVDTRLRELGVRSALDDRREKLGFKIREAETQKIPLMLVVGDQEMQDGTVTPRWRRGGNRPPLALDALAEQLAQATAERRAEPAT